MPLYMDVHNVPSISYAEVVEAHKKDLEIQGEHNVDYREFFVDEENGKIYCLVEAPDPESANRVHSLSHGLVAQEIHEVKQG